MSDDVSRSPFVFIGQVLAQGAATMDAVPIDGGTYVVGVTETVTSPDSVGSLSGFEITVQQEEPTLLVGETYVFNADGWLFGDGLAVVATDAAPYEEGVVQAALESAEPDPIAPVRKRVAEAELIVTGHVSRVSEVKRRAGEPITEHSPEWCEAVIEVDSVERSQAGDSPKKVTVRFSASQDAGWAAAPKFSIGDEGLFMLGNVEDADNERAVSNAKANQYTLARPEDAVSLSHLDDVRSIIEGM